MPAAEPPDDMLERMPLATALLSRSDHRILHANHVFRDLLVTPDIADGLTIDALVHPQDRSGFACLFGQSPSRTQSPPLRFIKADGQPSAVCRVAVEASGAATGRSGDILVQLIEVDASEQALAELKEREARWNSALVSSSLGVWDHDFKTAKLFYSDTWRKIRGLVTDAEFDAALDNWINNVHPDDRAHVLHAIERQNAGDPAYGIFEYRERHADGHWIWIECRGACVERDENGKPTHIIGTDTDITERKAAEELLAHVSRRLELALEISGIGVFEADIDKDEVVWDDRLLAIYGVEGTPHLKDSKFWEQMLHPDDVERVQKRMRDDFRGEHEYRIISPRRGTRVIRARSGRFMDERGRQKLIGANWDITEEVALSAELQSAKTLAEARNGELEAARERIEHIAFHDHLTDLPNRYYLDQVLDRRSQECRSDGSLLVILHIDLDRFKQINDTLGHRAGDMMLKHVAKVLTDAVGKDDFVARIGGDEFVVVCKRDRLTRSISGLAARIIRDLCKPVRFEGHDCRFGASIGIACDNGADLDARQLLLNADIALYRAKAKGRNRHEFFTLDAQHHVVTTKRLSDEMLLGIERGEFTPVYQLQFCARTLDVIGAETLARWAHPTAGMLTPDKFLAIAEDLDVVSAIDGLMLEKALADQSHWRAAGIDIPKISVNVSSQRLSDPALAKSLRSMKIKPGTVSFELLESISLDQCDDMSTANLRHFRKLGIDIEIDDFGTGHASIVSLLRLSPTRLKIDRELTRLLPESDEQRGLVRSIVEIGHSLSIKVIAEGVESMTHARILDELGCDGLQGYALARPMPANEIAAFVRAESWRPQEAVKRARA